jgi:hypothetical protein
MPRKHEQPLTTWTLLETDMGLQVETVVPPPAADDANGPPPDPVSGLRRLACPESPD